MVAGLQPQHMPYGLILYINPMLTQEETEAQGLVQRLSAGPPRPHLSVPSCAPPIIASVRGGG